MKGMARDDRSKITFAPAAAHPWGRAALPTAPRAPAHSALTSETSRSSDFLASPKSIWLLAR